MNAEHLKKYITPKNLTPIIKHTTSFCILFFNEVTKYRLFIVAFLITLLFYAPALRHDSINAGLLYSGDILSYYLPALIKTHLLLWQHHFSAIDYSAFNGSSDFFLNANFFPLHPIVTLYSLLFPLKANVLKSTGHFLVIMLAFHSFLACYFSLKLFTRYFLFEFRMALLIAIGFTFSEYMIGATMEPSFVFCASVVPWMIYAVLRFTETPSLKLLLFACLSITFGILGGYLPEGFACILLAAIIVAAKLFFIDSIPENKEERLHSVIFASLPFILAFLVTSPYLYAAYKFLKQTTSTNAPGLFYSAQQLAELPQSFIRLISSHFIVPGPFFEYSILWGIIGLTIFFIFFLSSAARDALNVREWSIFKVVAPIYFATVLAIYGAHSAVSSLVYYFVPQIGKMHIYQRFLLPGQLLLLIMIALMLKALTESRPQRAIKVALVFLVIITFTVGFLMTFRSNIAVMFGINNLLLFELMLGCLFAGILFIPGNKFAYYGTIILFCLPALNQMYSLSQGNNTFDPAQSRQPMALNTEVQAQLIAYLQRFKHKPIIKYADLTPLWTPSGIETFPKDFPYFVLNKINLSAYSGSTFYLSSLADYQHRMPVGGSDVEMKPDWQWLKDTGADFIIAAKKDIATSEVLQDLVKKNKPADLYNLPNDAVIIPLPTENKTNALSTTTPLYDNGYFRVYPTQHIVMNDLALNKPATQSGGNTVAPARLAVDGNTDGIFSHGSVSHTTKNQNAWLDIDLQKNEAIDGLEIWNRTDCCSERLQNYWIFISNIPFRPTDTASLLRRRVKTWGQMGQPASPVYKLNMSRITGRYVRIQLSGTQALDESYLSLAEVKILKNLTPQNKKIVTFKNAKFYSNDANHMRLEFDANAPATVQYLFWNNPRLKYYLNGKRTKFANQNGLQTIEVPSGHNVIEIDYTHWPLILFWIFYILFIVLLLFSFIFDI